MAIRFEEAYSANGYTGDGATIAQTVTGNPTPASGSGVDTSGKTENVLGAWLLVAGVLIGFLWLAEWHAGDNQTFGVVKLSFHNMIVVTIYALLGLTLGKVFFTKVNVPGLSALFRAA